MNWSRATWARTQSPAAFLGVVPAGGDVVPQAGEQPGCLRGHVLGQGQLVRDPGGCRQVAGVQLLGLAPDRGQPGVRLGRRVLQVRLLAQLDGGEQRPGGGSWPVRRGEGGQRPGGRLRVLLRGPGPAFQDHGFGREALHSRLQVPSAAAARPNSRPPSGPAAPRPGAGQRGMRQRAGRSSPGYRRRTACWRRRRLRERAARSCGPGHRAAAGSPGAGSKPRAGNACAVIPPAPLVPGPAQDRRRDVLGLPEGGRYLREVRSAAMGVLPELAAYWPAWLTSGAAPATAGSTAASRRRA